MGSLKFRVLVAGVVAFGVLGCRGWNGRGGACSSCSMSEGVVLGDSLGECTTCGKTAVVGEGMPMFESEPGMVIGAMPEHEGLSLEPIPEETPMPPMEARKEVRVEKQPEPAAIEPLPMPDVPKPAGLNVDLKSSLAVAMAGQDVTFDVVIENSGGTAIDSANMTVEFSEGLRPKSVAPKGVAKIEGQRVVFEPLRNFQPMSMTYQIVAATVAGSAEGRVSVQITSPILPMGPLTEESVIRITP